MSEKKLVTQEAAVEIELLIEAYQKKYSEPDYSKAYVQVLRQNPELAEAYTKGQVSKKAYSESEKRVDKFDAGKRVARLIEDEMLTYNLSYEGAMKRVLTAEENQELVKVYMQG